MPLRPERMRRTIVSENVWSTDGQAPVSGMRQDDESFYAALKLEVDEAMGGIGTAIIRDQDSAWRAWAALLDMPKFGGILP